ncbi:G-type lectin S-receptor-like serine/threonine-protein kinase LECRK2 [Quercus robur]|uniref:G-type lectin S-receptor-like serine/threonine-protein kinase LECRK2 n=1 Tax=Quercus robur TaxID=38942 RepID=UPI00216190A5|nr:G-type lectin S-receptor-like serine/threonine-protein kinase LECRK2 [Quercus robur]
MALQLSYLLSLLLLVLLLPYSTTAQTSSNQSLGSSLTAQEKGSYWASPFGDFAFGFQQIGNGGYLLAIWFNKIPEKTIVWSANGDNLVPTGSKVELTEGGQLVLSDPTGTGIWKSELGGLGVVHAAMLDTGNFVLTSQDGGYLWQSFDHPTDTMLPTQTMSMGSKLVAHYSERNNSNGRFQFALQIDGNLVLQTIEYPTDWSNTAYWLSETIGSGFRVVFNESGSIYLTARNGSLLTVISSNPSSTQDFYQRAIMEYDGVFTQYVYPKKSTNSTNAGRWRMAWSSVSYIPDNICHLLEDIGSGACGFNSYCILEDDGKPNCRCPPGYTFINPDDIRKGCKQNFLPQSCDEASSETDQFDLSEMESINWPQSGSDYARYGGDYITEDWCRKACLDDCFCAAAVFEDRKCLKKKIPLSNGRLDPNNNAASKVLIKTRKDNSTFKPPGADLKKKNHSTVILIVSVLLSSSMFLNLLFMLAAFLLVFRLKYWKPKALKTCPFMPGVNLQSYNYEELTKATNGFKEELGRGAFAKVYKGVLEYEDRKLVAVKRLNNMEREGDMEFKAEVSAIGRTNHRNLVQLLGFCNEGEHRLLVYEFMSNGSLASFLFGGSRPYWYQRIQIALETARGLFYLHEECSIQIIHCDIKPQNILLDDSFSARISDFGLAKLLKTDQTRTTTGIRGTKGYVAPEWFRNMPVTIKVDVYSFGILLLELICCRKSFESEAENEDQMILADWAYDCYKDKKLDLLVENDEEATNDMKRVEKYVMIAIWCIQEDPSLRPTMKKVVQMMEGSIEVSVPPGSSSFISSM